MVPAAVVNIGKNRGASCAAIKVHRLRAGGAGQTLQRKRLQPTRLDHAGAFGIGLRMQHAHQGGTGLELTQPRGFRRLHAQHDIGLAKPRVIGQLRAPIQISLVDEARAGSGAGFDPHAGTQPDEFARRLRRQRHAPFAQCVFLDPQHLDSHACPRAAVSGVIVTRLITAEPVREKHRVKSGVARVPAVGRQPHAFGRTACSSGSPGLGGTVANEDQKPGPIIFMRNRARKVQRQSFGNRPYRALAISRATRPLNHTMTEPRRDTPCVSAVPSARDLLSGAAGG
jgi:hypothetical protein